MECRKYKREIIEVEMKMEKNTKLIIKLMNLYGPPTYPCGLANMMIL